VKRSARANSLLAELVVKDFALIDDASIAFGAGLNALTGETGAGKSILAEALSCVCGARAREEWIREGRATAQVSARFTLDASDPLLAELASDGVDAPDGELILRREIARGGRGRAWVNGAPATLAELRRAGERLVDFHGQHESQTLLAPARHLEILDEFARAGADRAAVAEACDAHERARAAHNEEAAAIARVLETRAALERELREIDEIGAAAGEEERLEEERGALVHRTRLLGILDRADADLSGEEGAAARADHALRLLREAAALDSRLAEARELVDSALIELSEAAAAVSALRRALAESEGRVEEILSRLEKLARLRKRYGSVEGALERRAAISEDLARVAQGEGRLEDLALAVAAAERELKARANALSSKRARATDGLASSVARGLADLGMPRAVFSVNHEARAFACATRSGVDTVEFFLAPNPGEGRHPLARIASGGELSRVLLAILTALGEGYGAAVSVFDEVDAGVGADLAGALGNKLHTVARGRQVLVITHFAQIAAQADSHLHVSKEVRAGRTRVAVSALAGESRSREIARMLGGEGDAALRHAQELLGERRAPAVAASRRALP
jgi:DNA repair protein RecN (Recombination protein N)